MSPIHKANKIQDVFFLTVKTEKMRYLVNKINILTVNQCKLLQTIATGIHVTNFSQSIISLHEAISTLIIVEVDFVPHRQQND